MTATLTLNKYNFDHLRADINLDNLSDTGNKRFLNKTQITNTILTSPNMITLDLTDGVLTLKAGSKAVIPYGTAEPELNIGDSLSGGIIDDISWDGSKLFYIVEISKDIAQINSNNNLQRLTYLLPSGSIGANALSVISSGESAPELTSVYAVWYDTGENIIKYTSDTGASWLNYCSFGFCIETSTDNVITSIDQTFQSTGYIGSTYYINKDTTVLIPNGRKSDGTLNNIEYTTKYFTTYTINSPQASRNYSLDSEGNLYWFALYTYYVDSFAELPVSLPNENSTACYCADVNYWYLSGGSTTPNWNIVYRAPVFYGASESTSPYKITALTPYQTAQLATIADIDGKWVYSSLALCTQLTATETDTNVSLAFDLSDYLPKDNERYEVKINGYVFTASSSGAAMVIYAQNSSGLSMDITATKATSSVYALSRGSTSLIIEADRQIYITYYSGNALGQIRNVSLEAYRKVR